MQNSHNYSRFVSVHTEKTQLVYLGTRKSILIYLKYQQTKTLNKTENHSYTRHVFYKDEGSYIFMLTAGPLRTRRGCIDVVNVNFEGWSKRCLQSGEQRRNGVLPRIETHVFRLPDFTMCHLLR